ncbi:MAG: hydrogenase [Elainellaceae cyanobacterium]
MNCHLAATLKSLRHSVLVIGYGSPLRNDDGVGQQIATDIANWRMPNVEAIAVHQLTPELVEKLAETDIAIFVDAYPSSTKEVQVHSLALAQSGITTGHWCDPSVLLATTQALYGVRPQAWWVTVPGENFELGECLSSVAQQGIETALETIERLIQTARANLCMKSE